MELTLIWPTKKQVFQIAWIELNTPVGNRVIQKDHAPMIVILTRQKPLTFMLLNGKKELVMVYSAIAEISRLSVTIVLNEGA